MPRVSAPDLGAAGPGAADARAAMDALRRLVRALRASSRAAERAHAVSAAQLFALRAVAAEPGLALGALAEHTYTRQSSASEVVARLVERGLVERRADAADARRRALYLTPAGRALVRAAGRDARGTVPERLVAALGALPAADRTALARGLTRWVAAAGLDGVTPAMFFEARGTRGAAPRATARAAAGTPAAGTPAARAR